MKAELTGEQRTKFLENEGRFYAGTGHFANYTDAFERMTEFAPFKDFKFGRADWAPFMRGFKEVQDLRILVMLTKAKAQAENSMMLKELEGRGMTFLNDWAKKEE